jgi:DNA-binding NarL/FixJ family response regulator
MIRVLVVHRVRLTCDLIAAALKSESKIEVVGAAHCAEQALAQIKDGSVDLALINVNLPEDGAFQLTRAIALENHRNGRQVKSLISGLVQSKAAVLRCVEEGASGYVLEDEGMDDLVQKICAVHAGRFALPPGMAGVLINRVAELKRQVATIRTLTTTESYGEVEELTAREMEVLRLIERNYSNQQIADTLVIELGTVKNHVHNILRKLDVNNRRHAVIFARQMRDRESANHRIGAGVAPATVVVSAARPANYRLSPKYAA